MLITRPSAGELYEYCNYSVCPSRVKSGNFGHQVNSDIHLQTVDIQMRRLLMSRLIRIFTVSLDYLFSFPIIIIRNKQCHCPNLPDVRSYMTLPYVCKHTIQFIFCSQLQVSNGEEQSSVSMC